MIYVAFLRAINVGGRFVKMAALAQHFRALGHDDVETYINSGNVVFRSASRSAATLVAALEAGLSTRLGFETHAFVRTAAQVREIAARGQALVDAQPTLADINVAFVGRPLQADQVAVLHALRSEFDDFVVQGAEVYWLCRIKQSGSGFSNVLFERKLKTRTTLRRVHMLQGLSQRLGGATPGAGRR